MEKKVEKSKSISVMTALGLTLMIMVLAALIYFLCSKYINMERELVRQKLDTNRVIEEVKSTEKEQEQKLVTINESSRISNYIDKIYSYYEKNIPEFTNINLAEDDWVWSIALFNCQSSTSGNPISYKDIEKSAADLFGKDFTKKLSKSDMKIASYSSYIDAFTVIGRGGPVFVPKYVISDISKTENGFEVKILEYLEDNSAWSGSNELYEIYLIGNSDKIIKKYKNNQKEEMKDYVLKNQDEFNAKKIVLTQDSATKQIYIASSKNI